MSCVLVLGLPRSGTSAVAGALHHLGIPMGDNLMPALSGVNDRGFYEDVEFVDLHIKLMRAHEDPQILFDVPNPLDEVVLADWQKLIDRRNEKPIWGMKDPKMCFLLSYFLARCPNTEIVVVRRPFHECVKSLKPLYGGMSIDRAATLQARYLYSLDRNLAEIRKKTLPRRSHVEIDYHSLLRNPDQIFQLADSLGFRQPGSDQRAAAVSFIDSSLKRQA